jgi:periplasmic divalent cation tolerance protein
VKEEISLDKILVMTTLGSEQQAIDIAQELVQKKLAACVSYSMRFHSVYWWEGKVCSDQEVIMLIKSTKNNEAEIMETIVKLHDYEVPEVITLDIKNGYKKYLNWIESVVNS